MRTHRVAPPLTYSIMATPSGLRKGAPKLLAPQFDSWDKQRGRRGSATVKCDSWGRGREARGLVRGDLGKAVQQLKRESGKGLFVAGVKLPQALAQLGLIDEYEFVVHPRLVGYGPALF